MVVRLTMLTAREAVRNIPYNVTTSTAFKKATVQRDLRNILVNPFLVVTAPSVVNKTSTLGTDFESETR